MVYHPIQPNNVDCAEISRAAAPKSLYRNQQQQFYLCCVCQEENTTYRYQVVYRAPKQNPENRILSQQEEEKEDNVNSSEDYDHEYYNFPLRHPRHGHLIWQGFFANQYPDYPVHIKTFTIKRILDKNKKGKKWKKGLFFELIV